VLEFRVQFRWEDPMPSIQNRPSTKLVGDRHHCSSAATQFAASHPTHVHCDPNLPRLTFFFLFFVLFFLIQLRGNGDFLHGVRSCKIFFSSFSKIKKIKPKKKLDNFWLTLSALFQFRVSCSSRPSLICARVDRYCMILPLYPGDFDKTFRHLLKIFCKKNIKSVSHKSPKIYTTV